MNDCDWLDLRDPRTGSITHTELTPTADINAAFDQVAALFEAYPEAKSQSQTEKMTSRSKRGGKKGRTTK